MFILDIFEEILYKYIYIKIKLIMEENLYIYIIDNN